MNICFLLAGFYSNGGIGRVTSIITEKLSQNDDYNIFTLCYANQHDTQTYELSPKIKKDYLFDELLTMKKAIMSKGIHKLKTYLLENDIDVLIACGSLYFPISVMACFGSKAKCICWDHTGPNVSTDHQYQRESRWFGAKFSDFNILLTKSAKEYYDLNFGRPEKNIVIYNPIDSKAETFFESYNINSKKILTVGRLAYQKNYEDLVLIASKVLKNNPDWTWDIYGEGESRGKIEKLIDECSIGNQLILKGQVDDIYSRYKDYSFIVMTSRYEGFPMTLLEASANGLPMVSFDIETGPNEIINSQNGFLVPWNENKNDKMVESIEKLIKDENLRRNFSKDSKKISKEFAIDATIKCWNDVFKML